jgi:hypothetical protein
MIGKDQKNKKSQEQIGPTRVANVGESIRHEDGYYNKNQPIHQHIASQEQKQQCKSRHNNSHRNLSPYCYRFLKVGITASKQEEEGTYDKQQQQPDILKVKSFH